MRTRRLVVAFAALMAASALVAVPDPAGARPSAPFGAIDPATISAVTLDLPSGETAMTATARSDSALGPATEAGPDAAFVVTGQRTVPERRPATDQPKAKVGVVVKNFWRFDPDISWYGPGFFGSGTACGQKYTREIMGVAHRTLPCGTRVTFRHDGRQVTVPVIDRGPYVAGRTWDMSRALCEYLDHCFTGSIEWRWAGRR